MNLSKRIQALEAREAGQDFCRMVIVTLVGCSDEGVIGLSGPHGMIERLPGEAMAGLESRAALAWTQAGCRSGLPIIARAYYGGDAP